MHIIPLEYPCTMDGGDILYTGKHLFVGLSKRTNEEAFKMLQIIFKDRLEVIPVPVSGGLHLKSILSCFDTKTLIVAETRAGLEVKKSIQALTNKDYQFVFAPDPEASNVLRVGNTLIVQEGFPRSESIFFNLCIEKRVKLVKLNMSELIKADGALTCGSILFK